jgi:hypothetical protein
LADYSIPAHKYFGGNTVSSTNGGGKLSFYMHNFEPEFNCPVPKWIQSTSSHCIYVRYYHSELPYIVNVWFNKLIIHRIRTQRRIGQCEMINHVRWK